MKQMIKKYNGYNTPSKCGIQCRVNKPKGEYPLHRHDYIEMEYIAEGKIEQEINGVKTVGERGNFYCFFPHDLHRFNVITPTVIHNICIDYASVPVAVRKVLNSFSSPATGKAEADDLNQLNIWFNSLKSIIESGESYTEEKITAYALLILSYIAEKSFADENKPVKGFDYMSKAMNFIAEHYKEDISYENVAFNVYLSPAHFSKIFTKFSGITFSDYLTLFRLEKCCELLEQTNIKIIDVGYECGFNSYATYTRSFKKRFGCTPGQYRQKTTICYSK